MSEPTVANNDLVFLTAAEAMAILRLKRSTFYAYVSQGVIPVVQ